MLSHLPVEQVGQEAMPLNLIDRGTGFLGLAQTPVRIEGSLEQILARSCHSFEGAFHLVT
ncbi:hypothetical protein [Pseudomonas parafulva]|uniref:hypothetical protein n=1 Tax=Pseudomonas parafulva TaxID=157782 RepID=UPI0013C2AE6B|nr:hypothetical protein [Pseudomonas parafulva]